tara:strand:+ start:200 stop:1318 length:1119 start_codon:yes stop_codon:yes gene_type:complete
MSFSIQVFKTGALIALTGGTILTAIASGHKLEDYIRTRYDKKLDDQPEASTEKDEEVDYEYKYIDDYQTRFEKIKNNETTDEHDEHDEHDEEYSERVKKELENKLNNKKIHEITPRGDVIMYYDVGLESFVYYCNDKQIPYKYLETVARKYSLDNDCLEIFVNMYEELKKGIERQKEAKIKKCIEDKEKDKEKQASVKTDVFANFKQYNQKNPKEMIKQRKYITKENANRYSYRGTISDGEKLRIEDPKKKDTLLPPNEETLGRTQTVPEPLTMDSVKKLTHRVKEAKTNPKKLSFADFKRMQSSSSIDSLPVKTLEEWVESDNDDTSIFTTKDDSPTFSPQRPVENVDNDDSELTVNESDLTEFLGNTILT